MIIDCVSDLHGHFPSLPGGDLLIVAGDLTARDTYQECIYFGNWLRDLDYREKIFIGGNHDNLLQNTDLVDDVLYDFTYLQDSGSTFEGMKIWGSPWTLSFPGMNTKCKAFCLESEEEIGKKFDLIPLGTDILITHMPPYGIMDGVWMPSHASYDRVGSVSLAKRIDVVKPKLVVFGHIHEGYGKEGEGATMYVNACHVNEYYAPVNGPIRIVL